MDVKATEGLVQQVFGYMAEMHYFQTATSPSTKTLSDILKRIASIFFTVKVINKREKCI